MQQKRCLGELYFFLSDFLLARSDFEQSITQRDIILIIGKFLHVKDYTQRFKIFQELIEYGYIVPYKKQIDGMHYKVVG